MMERKYTVFHESARSCVSCDPDDNGDPGEEESS